MLKLLLSFLAAISFIISTNLYAVSSRGEALFKLCSACHGDHGEGKKELEAPAIAGLPVWYIVNQLNNFRNGVRGLNPHDLTGMRMRPMARTLGADGDVQIIAEYVANITPQPLPKTIEGRWVKGETLFQVCTACHGADGKGNQQLNAPPLIYSNDWYHVNQLKKFKEKVRGNPNNDPVGATMQPQAMMLDDQGMKDVAAYINILKETSMKAQ